MYTYNLNKNMQFVLQYIHDYMGCSVGDVRRAIMRKNGIDLKKSPSHYTSMFSRFGNPRIRRSHAYWIITPKALKYGAGSIRLTPEGIARLAYYISKQKNVQSSDNTLQ